MRSFDVYKQNLHAKTGLTIIDVITFSNEMTRWGWIVEICIGVKQALLIALDCRQCNTSSQRRRMRRWCTKRPEWRSSKLQVRRPRNKWMQSALSLETTKWGMSTFAAELSDEWWLAKRRWPMQLWHRWSFLQLGLIMPKIINELKQFIPKIFQ